MKIMYKIIIAVLICSLPFTANAQEDNEERISITVSMYDRLRSDIKVSRDSTILLADSCAKLNKCIQESEQNNIKLLKSNESYRQLANNKESIITSRDSLIEVLRNQHETDSLEMAKTNSRFFEMQRLIDETSAKYANGRLYFKFDASRIQGCLEDYNKITTASVKEQFKQMPELLKNYGNYSEQLKELLLSAHNDPDRKVRNKAEEYKTKYSHEIRSSFYYRNYYSKKKSGIWSIPYLNNIIEVALSILQKHDPGHNDPVNFSSLIEML